MKSEQLIYGLFKHHGIKLIRSQGISQLLTSDIVDYLCHIEKPGTHQNLWPNGVITVTKVDETNDEYGRSGVWNHTFAFRLIDFLQEMPPLKLPYPWIPKTWTPPTQLVSVDVKP